MSEQLISSVVTVAIAIIGLAIIATLVSKNAQTANVIQATGVGFVHSLYAAEAPVLGGLNVAGTYNGAGYQQ